MDFTKLVEYKEWGVMITLIGVIYLMTKNFLNHLRLKECRDEKTFQTLSENILRNSRVTNEMYTYLKMRNGNDTRKMLEEVKKYQKIERTK